MRTDSRYVCLSLHVMSIISMLWIHIHGQRVDPAIVDALLEANVYRRYTVRYSRKSYLTLGPGRIRKSRTRSS